MEKHKGISRRQFLTSSALAGAGLFVSVKEGTAQVAAPFARGHVALASARIAASRTLRKYVDQLPIPPVWSTSQLAANGLTMAASSHRFHRNLGPARTWGYGGASYLGPTINATSGSAVSFTARNQLGRHVLGVDETLHGPNHSGVNDQQHPRVSLHLHGGYTEPQSDGYPEDTFLPGSSKLYTYANDQQSSTLMYHDHALGITRLNVYAGLAGFYLIRESQYEAGLPSGEFEIPLAIQDKSFNANGTLFYPDPWVPEFFGDVAVVNGKAWPNLDVKRGLYRFRLLNGSSSRFYNLKLSSGQTIYQIGTDSGLLAAPATLNHIVLAPGERADVLIDFSGRAVGEKIQLMNDTLPAEVSSPANIDIPEIMQFTVISGAGFSGSLPTTLRPFAQLTANQAVQQRNLLLVEIMGADGPVMSLLNNRPWDTNDIEQPKVNTVEQWNLINLTADTHPIHLHLVQFQLLNRQAINTTRYLREVFMKGDQQNLQPDDVGKGTMPYPDTNAYVTGSTTGPALYEAGWKDTIQAHPGMVTRILVPFGPGAATGVPFGQQHTGNPFTGKYVWHCHILDHEDNEMMLPYEVVSQ